MIEDLNDENFELYASKAYEKPGAITAEFEEDIKKIQHIKRLITKYLMTGEFKDRLLVNHIIIFYNVFGVVAATRILFLKLKKRELEVLKPILIMLNYLPTTVEGINGKTVITNDIKLDKGVIECLRKI